MCIIPPVIKMSLNFSISTDIFSADVAPEMLKLCRVTKSKGVLSSAGIHF